MASGALPVACHAFDAGQVESDVRHRMLVTVGESISAERLEDGSRVVELPGPLEQHPVGPARIAEDRAPPDLALEGQRTLDRRERDSASTTGLVEGDVGERAREHPGLAELLRQFQRVVRALLAQGDVAGFVGTPSQPALGLDPQSQVVAYLGECRLEELGADREALPEGADPREPVERTGTVAPGRGGVD